MASDELRARMVQEARALLLPALEESHVTLRRRALADPRMTRVGANS